MSMECQSSVCVEVTLQSLFLYMLPKYAFNASVFSLDVHALDFVKLGICVLVFNLGLTYDQNGLGLFLLLSASFFSKAFRNDLVSDTNLL